MIEFIGVDGYDRDANSSEFEKLPCTFDRLYHQYELYIKRPTLARSHATNKGVRILILYANLHSAD
jgi:hypothetical protein